MQEEHPNKSLFQRCIGSKRMECKEELVYPLSAEFIRFQPFLVKPESVGQVGAVFIQRKFVPILILKIIVLHRKFEYKLVHTSM